MGSDRAYVNVCIDKDLWNSIKEYGKENELNPTKFANELLKKAFMYEKYGDTPFTSMKTEMNNVVVEVMERLKEEEEMTEIEEVSVEQENNYEPLETNNDLPVETKAAEEIKTGQTKKESKKRRLK